MNDFDVSAIALAALVSFKNSKQKFSKKSADDISRMAVYKVYSYEHAKTAKEIAEDLIHYSVVKNEIDARVFLTSNRDFFVEHFVSLLQKEDFSSLMSSLYLANVHGAFDVLVNFVGGVIKRQKKINSQVKDLAVHYLNCKLHDELMATVFSDHVPKNSDYLDFDEVFMFYYYLKRDCGIKFSSEDDLFMFLKDATNFIALKTVVDKIKNTYDISPNHYFTGNANENYELVHKIVDLKIGVHEQATSSSIYFGKINEITEENFEEQKARLLSI